MDAPIDNNLGSVTDFEDGNDEEYKVDGIRDSTVFAKESEADYLPEICLPGEAEHLGACIGSSTPPKASQRLYPNLRRQPFLSSTLHPDGSTSDGSTSDGSTHDGSTSDGSTHDGLTPDGFNPQWLYL